MVEVGVIICSPNQIENETTILYDKIYYMIKDNAINLDP